MFSSAVEFIPSHSTTTSTSTTATLTPVRMSHDFSENSIPETSSQESSSIDGESLNSLDKRTGAHKKGKSWSFIRFRKKVDTLSLSPPPTEEEDEVDGVDDDVEVGYKVGFSVPRPATPPSVSHVPRATHYLTRSATPEPMIDLDAALGPSGTPSLLSGAWTTGSVFHRRTESAPGMIAGTKSVDFRTFSKSMNLALAGVPRSSGDRGMKYKMGAVAEIAEEVDESAIEECDRSSSSGSSEPLEIVDTADNKRRSIWEDFVSSLSSEAKDGNQLIDSEEFRRSAAAEDVLIVDDSGEAVMLGEPGPEIRHSMLLESDSAGEWSAPSSLHNAGSISTVSDEEASPAAATVIARKPATSGSGLARKRSQEKRRSVVLGLKNAMMKSQSVGNLLPSAESESPSKASKLHRRLPSKHDVADLLNIQQRRHSENVSLLGLNKHGWRSQGNLPAAGTQPIISGSRHRKHASVGTTRTSSTMRAGTLKKNDSEKAGKSTAGRMWDWMKGMMRV